MEKVVVGQEVVVSGRYNGYLFGYFVTKVSPSGQITVAKGADKIVFNPDGRERTSDKWHKHYLCLNVQELKDKTRGERKRMLAVSSVRKVSEAVNEVGNGWDKESLQAKIQSLQTLLDAAKKAVDEI